MQIRDSGRNKQKTIKKALEKVKFELANILRFNYYNNVISTQC